MLAKDKKIIIAAAKAGGKIVRNYFGKVLDVKEKSTAADFRTQADVESEAAIIKILNRAFPAHNIFSEESGFTDKKSEYTFYIDPLDGTNNFVLGIPNFSVSIAVVRGRQIVFGLVYLPVMGLMYSAAKGGGAFCNSLKLQLSSEAALERSTASFLCDYHCPKPFIVKTIGNLSLRMKRVLVNWSVAADLCLLASGKIETVLNRKTELWDFLAGKLIAKEAGCVITDFKGRPDTNDFNDTFLASGNAPIHRKTLSLL